MDSAHVCYISFRQRLLKWCFDYVTALLLTHVSGRNGWTRLLLRCVVLCNNFNILFISIISVTINGYLRRSTGVRWWVGEAYISLKTTEHKSMGAVCSLFVVATWTAGFGWILTISPIFRQLSRVAISRQLSNRITSRARDAYKQY